MKHTLSQIALAVMIERRLVVALLGLAFVAIITAAMGASALEGLPA